MKKLKDKREMMLIDQNLKLDPAEIKLRDACTRKRRYKEMISLISSSTPPTNLSHALPFTTDPPSLAAEEDETFQLLLDGF